MKVLNPDKSTHHSHYAWFNNFLTRGGSKTLSDDAWNLLAKSWYDCFMSSICSTSRIKSTSLYCEASLKFLAESKMSMKILHFRSTSASTIYLLSPSKVALSQCFEVSKWHFLCVGCKLRSWQQNQPYFVPHE